MKKLFVVFVCAVIAIGLTGGCSGAADGAQDDGKLSIVCAIFPEYDWTKQILGAADSAELMLLSSGVDLHSYQPTAEDIIKISTCDLFIYVGGESDEWVRDALSEASNENMVVISLMDILDDAVAEEELVEGMETNEEAAEDGVEYDEHVWLSLKNAKTVCAYIAAQLSDMDAANADAYAQNAEAYIAKLDALDAEYQAAVNSAAGDTLLFADRFPFRYLAADYGLNYYAAFAGCSAETEASFETIAFLADKVDELGLTSVIVIEGAGHRIAETIIENTASGDQTVLTLDSMQSTTLEDAEAGTTYLSIMQSNLEVLKQALN